MVTAFVALVLACASMRFDLPISLCVNGFGDDDVDALALAFRAALSAADLIEWHDGHRVCRFSMLSTPGTWAGQSARATTWSTTMPFPLGA
jgi:hypothetical protein